MSELWKKFFNAPFRLPGTLEQWSFAYLGLPLVFYFFGQLETWIFCLLALLGVGALRSSALWRWSFPLTPLAEQLSERQKWSWWAQAAGLLLWALLSGSGDYFFVNGDYFKHSAILNELVNNTWPVYFTTGTSTSVSAYLHYYFGNYIVPALIGKWLGPMAGIRAVFYWNFLGLMLAYLWSRRALGQNPWWFLPFLIFFGGLDAVATYALKGSLPELGSHLEWWNGYHQYSSNSTLLFWVPQHTLPSWILAGTFFSWTLEKKTSSYGLLLFSLSAFWSPFAMFGLAPFFLAHFLHHWRTKEWISRENLLGVLILAIMASFYFSGALAHRSSWIWDAEIAHWPFLVGQFLLVEIGPWLVLSLPVFFLGRPGERTFLALALLSLAVIPLYIFGMYNDSCMRVSIPGLYILAILSARSYYLFQSQQRKIFSGLLALFILLALPTGFSEIWRTLKAPLDPPPFSYGVDQLPLEIVTAQYLGVPAGTFYRYLVRPVTGQGAKLRPGVWDYLKHNHLPLWDSYFKELP